MLPIHRVSIPAALAAALLVCGCFYDTSGGAADVDAGGTDTGTDTGAPDAGIGGLGDPCTETGGECAGLEAGFCLYNPTDAAQGVCTTTGCLASGCPATYSCCDCTAATYFFTDLCAPAEYASMLPMAGCSCS
jgi:hypothetical protein